MRFRSFLIAVLLCLPLSTAAEAQLLELPGTGVWNGFNRQNNIVECNNGSGDSLSLLLTIFDDLGFEIARQPFAVGSYATVHLLLDGYPIQNRYGTYVISLASGNPYAAPLNCFTVFYRFAPAGGPKLLEYAFTLPVANAIRGESSGVYNSLNPENTGWPVLNWLSVYNPTSTPFSATVLVYRQDGSLDGSKGFRVESLPPRGRIDRALGHDDGQVAGLYRIVPDDSSSGYNAFLARYSLKDAFSYNFAFALAAAQGTCEPEALPASTMNPATNWGEVANPTSLQLPVVVQVRDSLGTVVKQEQRTLPPFSQSHIYLNQYIGERQIGSLLVQCLSQAPGAAILLQSLYYGHLSSQTPAVEWAYASQARNFSAAFGDVMVSPSNTFLQSSNWNKYLDAGSGWNGLALTFYDGQGHGSGLSPLGLSPGASVDVGVHEKSGTDVVGLMIARSEGGPAHFSAELLRVFPHAMAPIGYILRVPTLVLPRADFEGQGVQRSALPHWLEFHTRPTMLIGDSVTQGWMELGTDFDQIAYLDALQARGINTFMIWSYIGIDNQATDSRIGYHAPRIWPWVEVSGSVVPPYRFQFVDSVNKAVFNEAYFQRLRSLVQAAHDRHIAVIITVHDGWTKARFTGHPFNELNGGTLSQNTQYIDLADFAREMPTTFNPLWSPSQKHQFYLERFSDRLIRATQDYPNVAYEMFNEGEWYNSNQLQAFQDHFLRFFSARTTRMLLVNDQHDGEGGHYRPQGSVDMVTKHSPNWSSQTDAYDSFEFYSREYYASPIKPILFGEPVPSYNGGSSQLRGIMRLLWGTVMGGASGFMLQNDTGWRWNPNALDPAFDVEGHASRFFNQSGIEFWNMEPREDVCSTSVCMASPDHYLVYSQGHATVTVYPDDTSGRYTVRFYNPRTGDYDPNVSQVDGAEEILITTPSTIDWVIWLAKQK